jgi:hypothetical protein
VKRLRYTCLLLTAAILAAGGSAIAFTRDGAIIRNSGSTNSAAYEIRVWSNGAAQWRTAAQKKDFAIDAALIKRFFAAVKAARANPGTPRHCMKSASFGTVTTVTWHGWTSGDLQCPPSDGASAELAEVTNEIAGASGVVPVPQRIRLPVEPRRVETPGTASPSPATEPSARTGGASRTPNKPPLS